MPDAQEPKTNSPTVWNRVAGSRPFKDLMATKRSFVVPAFVFFLIYYFLLPVLVGYAPRFMSIKVWGNVNLAYVFALSQFFMAWMIAWLYVRAADNFDKLSKDIVEEALKTDGSKGDN